MQRNIKGYDGWSYQSEYEITMIYNTFNVQVFVDGVEEFNEVGYFPGGTFSFYTYSQEGGIFSWLIQPVDFSFVQKMTRMKMVYQTILKYGLGMDPNSDDSRFGWVGRLR